MPELPEVETQVRQLNKNLKGLFFTNIQTDENKFFHPSRSDFEKKLLKKKIIEVKRRGKFLLFYLEKKTVCAVHFRMTGHFLIEKKENQFAEEKCVRVVFGLNNGWKLLYQDIRKFGRFWIGTEKEILELSGITRLGIEPLSDKFTFEWFGENIKKKKGALKPLLLNQNFIAGIGNIYADEALFRSGLHPLRKAEKLTLNQKKKLYEAIKHVLRQGVKRKGTTIGEYVDTEGKGGRNQEILHAYGRRDKPCLICGNKMERIIVAQRGTVFCPHCQKR